MKITQKIMCAFGVLAGLVLVSPSSNAGVYLGEGNGKDRVPTIKSAEDAISSIPILKKIPTSFIVGDGFRFKLTGMSLRIDHMGTKSRAPAHKRNCLVSFSYSTPVSFFGSRIEVPVFHSESLALSKWGVNTLGDYVVHLSKDASADRPVMGLMVSARF
ncbi:MAG: hypothetical protein A2992_08160 [Elusimicrobia bacterium RIFCSPLOWO2_01_FULL_59_12]|nr:MAG: hypothetical protein A2992_08160 [Elusimicrobia bacterium RIFCSPLOWO2_01_FULL_59_12]